MELKDGVPCRHPGCLNHVSHPCEGCGRIAGKSPAKNTRATDPLLEKMAAIIVYMKPAFFGSWRTEADQALQEYRERADAK